MSHVTLHARHTPPLATVLREQVGLVGLAVRRETLAGAFLIAVPVVVILLATLAGVTDITDDGSAFMDFDPGEGLGYFAGLVGALFAWLVWRGEHRLGDTALWTAPVAHRRHALAKVGAGWFWLIAAGGGIIAWALAITVLTGGSLGAEETRLLMVDRTAALAGEPGALERVAWRTVWWQWAIPFTGATCVYLLASALLLATERPAVWAVGAWLFFLGLAVVGEELRIPLISEPVHYAFSGVVWAVDVTLNGGGEVYRAAVPLPSGGRVAAWQAIPTAATWAAATGLWLALGVAGVWLAAGRRARS